MASFQFNTHEDIVKATGVCELKAPRAPVFQRRSSSNATWSVAFAPDKSRFAWSSGDRIVHILPWNDLQHVPIIDPNCLTVYDDNNNNNNNDEVTAANPQNDNNEEAPSEERKESSSHVDSDTNTKETPLAIKVKTLDCNDIVMSLAFGSSSTNKKMRHSKVKYRMYDYLDSAPGQLMLAMGLKSGKIKTYDIGNDVMLHLMDHREPVRDLAFSPDGSLTLVSASWDGTLKVWDIKDDGNMVKTLKGHNKPVIACSFSPNGKMLASVGCNKVAIIWEMSEKYSVVHRLTGHHHDIVGCQFSPDGALLVTASFDSRVCVWDPYTGECLQELQHVFPPLAAVFAGGANNHCVRDVSFSPDGSHIATVCDDKYVRFWSLFDTSDPQSVYPLENALTCTYSPNGNVLAAGTRNGQVKFVLAPMRISKLQHLCRLTIRRSVQDTRNLKQLNGGLPTGVIRYLAYRDIATVHQSRDEEEAMCMT